MRLQITGANKEDGWHTLIQPLHERGWCARRVDDVKTPAGKTDDAAGRRATSRVSSHLAIPSCVRGCSQYALTIATQAGKHQPPYCSTWCGTLSQGIPALR